MSHSSVRTAATRAVLLATRPHSREYITMGILDNHDLKDQ